MFILAFAAFNFLASFTTLYSKDLPGVTRIDRTSPTRTMVEVQANASTASGYPIPSVELTSMPRWIQNYFEWHKEMRNKFPGDELFTNENAPKLLIRTCSGSESCGGLHDRLGKLPWDMYLANQTERILLLNWCKPVPLEEFLVPNEFDWSIPSSVAKFFEGADACSGRVNRMTNFFEGFNSNRPTESFWQNDLDASLERVNHGSFAKQRIIKFSLLGDDVPLQERLRKAGEADFLDWTSSSFGRLFWLFFQPAPGLKRELDTVYQKLNSSANNYLAVHCRVRHPKAVPVGGLMEAKDPAAGGPDKVGLLWDGESRRFAIEIATRALQCAATILENPEEPLYFYSDSSDLVNYIAKDLQDDEFLAKNSSLFAKSPADTAALKTVQRHRIVALDAVSETLHIDRQPGFPASAYYASFVDLLVAIHARCVVVGVGNFALFAAKLSANPCVLQHQKEVWGAEGVKHRIAKQCLLDTKSS